jgi:hypothetical protein
MCVPPFFSLSQSCLILAQLYDGSKNLLANLVLFLIS